MKAPPLVCCVVWSSSSSLCHQTVIFHSSTHYFPTSLNVMRLSKEKRCATWKHLTCVPWFILLLHKHMWCSLCRTSTCFPLFCCKCTPCADVDAFLRCPWTMVTFCHLFVVVVVCYDQVRHQVSKGFRYRDS